MRHLSKGGALLIFPISKSFKFLLHQDGGYLHVHECKTQCQMARLHSGVCRRWKNQRIEAL